MRREEIEIGFEYAMHGPKAYGRIPSVDPKRIRFTSKDPNHRVVIRYRVGENAIGKRTLTTVDYVITKDYAHLPVNHYSSKVVEAERADIGDIVEMVEAAVPGGLPAEKWEYNGKTQTESWVPIIAQPASVHYTWQGWIEHQANQTRAYHQARVDAAPGRMSSGWYEIVMYARALKMSEADLRAWVEEKFKTTVL